MEFIKLVFLKKLTFYSIILGGICGILSLIPFLMPPLALFLLPFLGALIPLYLLIKLDGFTSDKNKTFALLGGMSGFFITAGYITTLVPSVALVHLIFKSYYDYGIQSLNLFLFVLFFSMIATVYIITNSAAGLIFGIIYKYLKENQNG